MIYKPSLEERVERLEELTKELCIANFLTQNVEGDEEIRDIAVADINRIAGRAKNEFKIRREYVDLCNNNRALLERMKILEEDFPFLKTIFNTPKAP